MKNILVPIGTSPAGHETLQYAINFAKAFDANVFVMEAVNVSYGRSDLYNYAEKAAASGIDRLKEIIAQVDADGVALKIATYNGDVVDGIKDINKELGIDLVIIHPKSNSIDEKVFLGQTSGKIVKQTDIPTLIVPQGAVFSPFDTILAAFKSGILKRRRIIKPLQQIQQRFGSQVKLLLVKTPGYTDDDLHIDPALMDLSSQVTLTENATTYMGVLEHFREQQPDLLCVFRRRRGFFTKLWEKSTIRKEEFHASIPVLVLSVKKY